MQLWDVSPTFEPMLQFHGLTIPLKAFLQPEELSERRIMPQLANLLCDTLLLVQIQRRRLSLVW